MSRLLKISRLLLLLFVCSVILVGCHPRNKKAKKQRIRKKPVSYLVKKIAENEFSPETFSGKAKLKFKQEDFTLRGDANIRIEKDEKIWISIAPKLGVQVEAVRALITPDSIKILDKFNKTFYAERFEYIQRFIDYPLSFEDLQTLILGGSLEKALFNEAGTKFGYHLISSDDCSLYLNPNDYTIYQMHLNDLVNNQKLTAVFNEYEELEKKYAFSNQRDYDIEAEGKTYELDLQFSKVKVDKPVEMPFNVKKSYKKGNL